MRHFLPPTIQWPHRHIQTSWVSMACLSFLKHTLIWGVATLNINRGLSLLSWTPGAINRAVMAEGLRWEGWGGVVWYCGRWVGGGRSLRLRWVMTALLPPVWCGGKWSRTLAPLLWDADWNLQGYTHATDSHVGSDTLSRARRVISKACFVLKRIGTGGRGCWVLEGQK